MGIWKYNKLCRYVDLPTLRFASSCVSSFYITEDSTPDLTFSSISPAFPTRTPAIEVSTHPSEGKKSAMHCFDGTLDNFIDRIRRCAISRIIEIRWLRIWPAAEGEWGVSFETDRWIGLHCKVALSWRHGICDHIQTELKWILSGLLSYVHSSRQTGNEISRIHIYLAPSMLSSGHASRRLNPLLAGYDWDPPSKTLSKYMISVLTGRTSSIG